MNKIFKKTVSAAFLILFFAASSFAATAFAPDPEPLAGLLRRAEQSSPVLSAEREKLARYEAEYREKEANLLPSASLAYVALHGKEPLIDLSSLDSYVGSSGMSMLRDSLSPLTTQNIYGAALTLTQTIYAGGSLQAMKSASRLARDSMIAEQIRTEQKIDNNVRKAYYNRKRAEEKQKVAEEALELAQEHLEQARQLFESGTIAKADVLRAQVSVSSSKQDLIRAANSCELALTTLERVVGGEIDPETLKSEPIKPGRPEKPEPKFSYSEANVESDIETAYRQRPELKMYSLLSKQAKEIARAQKGQLLPQIMGFASWSAYDDSAWPEKHGTWRIGAAATWNFYDSGRVKAKTEQAKAQSRELLYMLDDMKLSVKMEVKQAELDLRSSYARLEVAEDQVKTAEEDHRIAVLGYKESVKTNLDMLDARLALINSRTNLVDAIYDIEIAKANLIYAMGE